MHELLCHFLSVPFDDILIYSSCWEDHLVHGAKGFCYCMHIDYILNNPNVALVQLNLHI